MAEETGGWMERIAELARRASRRRAHGGDEPQTSSAAELDHGGGPWRFRDLWDRTWVLSTALLEFDVTLPPNDQVKALVCSCEDGWLFAIPVGAAFRPEHLSQVQLSRILTVAEGDARRQSDWEPSRSETRIVKEPASGRVFQVQVVTRHSADPADWARGVLGPEVLVFQERGGTWVSSIPLPRGEPIESLSRTDLLRLLWPSLDLEPLGSGALAHAAESPAAIPAGNSSRLVLLVEDHEELRAIYRTALQRAGFGVVEAETGHQALSLVAQHRGKLRAVVSDVIMPKIGGRELLWQLSESDPDLPAWTRARWRNSSSHSLSGSCRSRSHPRSSSAW
jgi:CheY-like chemotaxis protein